MIGVDWGSSNLRAYRYGPEGTVLERRSGGPGAAVLERDAFEPALAEILAGWTDGRVPIVLAGMAGRRGGWREAPYLPCPANPAHLAAAAVAIRPTIGPCFLVPGLSTRGRDGVAGVMRGEETQILGAGLADGVVVLPGTHSKWVRLTEGRITDFATTMTGELYALLLDHSLIGQTATRGACDRPDAFTAGVRRALAAGGIERVLFSARAEVLLGTLEPEAVESFLSGLLIGGEIAAMRGLLDGPPALIGTAALCTRYAAALSLAGYPSAQILGGEMAVSRGLWRIGRDIAALRGPDGTGEVS
ncbi:2-dehydro-3-deoxygalactonokinase [Methylorubrum podarium]|uniref:2-dehydro-3-deoxygalactonokinase n=1 Tax=Methylorubrum podarium TaxID=200476 RepID=UPI001EE2AEA9|nr:2-dehydro-3-deoxygalactonokinase [Methylorubrum podarium]GJE69288.1 putative 2-dehydro-3-deoxygalactonokinase DgoK1 [Methylorubrum podarium]